MCARQVLRRSREEYEFHTPRSGKNHQQPFKEVLQTLRKLHFPDWQGGTSGEERILQTNLDLIGLCGVALLFNRLTLSRFMRIHPRDEMAISLSQYPPDIEHQVLNDIYAAVP